MVMSDGFVSSDFVDELDVLTHGITLEWLVKLYTVYPSYTPFLIIQYK